MSHIIRVCQGYSLLLFFLFHINFSEGQICWGEEKNLSAFVLMGG